MLLDKLTQNGLIDEQGNIILVTYGDGTTQTVDVATFQTFFGTSEDYTTLIGLHTFTWNGEQLTRNSEQLGYKSFFDDWKAKGIIT